MSDLDWQELARRAAVLADRFQRAGDREAADHWRRRANEYRQRARVIGYCSNRIAAAYRPRDLAERARQITDPRN